MARKIGLDRIARIMSERTKCTVTAEQVREEISRPTTEIYSAVVPNNAGVNVCITCLVRKWKNPYEYVVQATIC